MMMNGDERNLIQQAQNGNQWAFERLIKKYDRKVFALSFRMLGNTQDAEDVYQDVFMKVYHNLKNFRFESDFYTWLYRIAINCNISYRKKRNLRYRSSFESLGQEDNPWQWIPADSTSTPDSQMDAVELREKIQSILGTLSLMQRTVFVLRFFENFKIKEIAEITGCAEGTVKNYIFRGTQKMRKHLSSYLTI